MSRSEVVAIKELKQRFGDDYLLMLNAICDSSVYSEAQRKEVPTPNDDAAGQHVDPRAPYDKFAGKVSSAVMSSLQNQIQQDQHVRRHFGELQVDYNKQPIFSQLLRLVLVLQDHTNAGWRSNKKVMREVFAILIRLIKELEAREGMLHDSSGTTPDALLNVREARLAQMHTCLMLKARNLQRQVEAARQEVRRLERDEAEFRVNDLNATIAGLNQSMREGVKPHTGQEAIILCEAGWTTELVNVLMLLKDFAIANWKHAKKEAKAKKENAPPYCQETCLKYSSIIDGYRNLILGNISYTGLIAIVLKIDSSRDPQLQSLQAALRKCNYPSVLVTQQPPFERGDDSNINKYYKGIVTWIATQLKDGSNKSLLIPYREGKDADAVFQELLSNRGLEFADRSVRIKAAAAARYTPKA